MKTLKMLKSEFIKLFSKKSTYFLIVGVIIATVGLTILDNTSNDYYSGYWGYESTWIQDYKNIKSDLINSTDRLDILKVKVLDFEIEVLEEKSEFEKQGKLNDDWKQEVYCRYNVAKTNCYFGKLILDGYTFEEIDEACAMLYNKGIGEVTFFEASEELKQFIAKNEKTMKTALEQLVSQDYIKYANDKILDLQEEVKASQLSIESLNKQKLEEKDNGLTNEISQRIHEQQLLIDANTGAIKVYQYIIDSQIPASRDNWKYNALSQLIDTYKSLYSVKGSIYSNEEEYYNSEQYYYEKLDYAMYCDIQQIYVQEIEDEISITWYAVNNDIKVGAHDARNLAEKSLSTYLVAIAGIIIAGAIVAHEFSTGTIRFLITRPVKRYKILLAKILMTVTFVIVLNLVIYTAVIVTSGLSYNMSDIFIPKLVVQNGMVMEQSFLITTLGQMFLNLIPMYVFIIFAFAMSTIFPHTAAAVGIGIGGLFGGYIANEIFMYNLLGISSILQRFPILKYTPLPYLDWSFYTNKIGAYKLSQLHGMTIFTGIEMLAIYIAIMLVVSFIVFIKRDIKNQ